MARYMKLEVAVVSETEMLVKIRKCHMAPHRGVSDFTHSLTCGHSELDGNQTDGPFSHWGPVSPFGISGWYSFHEVAPKPM